MKTGQVFVSHTSDMARFPKSRPFVRAAVDAVSRAGMAPIDMKYFAAQDEEPADYCRARVRGCEIYVAVIGFRYGSMVPGHEISYTELEFAAATAAGLPRLVFLLDESAGMAAGLADADRAPVERFRQQLRDAGLIVAGFSSADGLELEVFQALTEQASGHRPGGAGGPPAPAFGGLLRQLRAEMGLTQRALAQAAGVSSRAISDLERGKTLRAHKATVRFLADALNLKGPARSRFEVAAQGRLPASTLMRTLPMDIAEFTGRAAEQLMITESFRPAARNSPGATMIWAIDGMAGVGKSAFAVHAAHQAAARFPDGQIYLDPARARVRAARS
jgi:transcriptional regulator with XRE-family HTH domain